MPESKRTANVCNLSSALVDGPGNSSFCTHKRQLLLM